MENNDSTPPREAVAQQKTSLESLSKEELINKYKVTLNIAKKAKQAKDDYAEENRKLKESLSQFEKQKEADKSALLTMKEMLEEFTQNKLELATQLSELQKLRKDELELNSQLQIENESLKRQMNRLTDENEELLGDIERMEQQLQQVNVLGHEQKKNLELLEEDINNLKEAEKQNISLKEELNSSLSELSATKKEHEELLQKYQNVKEINSAQRKKFNTLKDRFIDVHRKLKGLKECKCVLLETQHEYADSISKWQREIIKASQLLCGNMNALQMENKQLKMNLEHKAQKIDVGNVLQKLNEMERLGNLVLKEQQEQQLEYQRATQELQDLKVSLAQTETKLKTIKTENEQIVEQLNASEATNSKTSLKEIEHLAGEFHTNVSKTEQSKAPLKKVKTNSKSSNENEKLLLEEKERFEREVEILNKKLQCNLARNETLEKENSEIKEHLNATNIKLNAILAQNDEKSKVEIKDETRIDILERENVKLTTDRDALKNLIDNIQANLFEEQKQLKEIKLEHEELLANFKDTKDRLIIAEKELSDSKQKYDKLSADFDKETFDQKCLSDLANKAQRKYIDTEALYEEIRLKHKQLEESFESANEKLISTEVAYKKLQQLYEEQQTRYKLKDREHADLLDEMRELNEALKGRGDMISRQKEKQQELLNELQVVKQKKDELEQALNETTKKLTQVTDKNGVLESELQSLRSQQDINAETQSEILSVSSISRAEELSRLRELDDSYEEKYNKLRGMAAKLKKKLQEQTSYVSEMEKQLSETNAQKQKLEELTTELKKTQQELNTFKTENTKLKSSRKQANVLNLEIEAAEKSLEEVSAKLTARNIEVETLKEELNSKDNTNVQLRKEISILETAKNDEVAHAKQLKTEIDRMQAKLKDAVHSQQQAITKSKEFEQSVEKYKLESEELQLQLATNANKHETVLSKSHETQANFEAQLSDKNERIQYLETALKQAERSSEDLRVEYLEYKVKAQAVLRKNQSKESSKERELEDELIAMRASEQQLKTELQNQKSQMTDLSKQFEIIKEDHDTSQRRNRELLHVLEELRQQNESSAQENQRSIQLQQDALRQHRQQIDNMDACHKAQIKQFQEEIQQTQAELQKAKRQPTSIGANAPNTMTTTSLSNNNTSIEQSRIEFLLMEREAAEGSEEAAESLANLAAKRKISTASRRSQHDFMPLDELLNTPLTAMHDKVTTRSLGRSSSTNEDVDAAAEYNNDEHAHVLQATKERLQIQESRVRHLTALLAENEQDLAKLTQMNDMLKEELRRQERSEEREQHMHNSEYLKNIFLKFLTLNNGDERMRLVPVLNTILKLSRNEVEMLSCVAKGQKVSNDSNNRSWGSFLSSWGNNNGGNNN